MIKFTICGGGSLGHVCAGFLGSRSDVQLRVYTQHPEQWSSRIEVTDPDGKIYAGLIDLATNDPEKAVSGADVILLCLPGNLIAKCLKEIKPFIGNSAVGSVVSSTGFFQEAHDVLGEDARLFGFQRVPFIARVDKYGSSARLLGYKSALSLAQENIPDARTFCDVMSDLFATQINLLDSWYQAALTNSNPILHTARLYSMFGGWDGTPLPRQSFFYREWDEASSQTLISMDCEFMALVEEICGPNHSITPILEYYESHDASSLALKLAHIPAFRDIATPMREVDGGWVPDFESRYFTEDFAYGLRFIWSLCHSHGIACPTIDKVYAWGIGVSHSSLRASHNPDGSLLRRAQLRMLNILVEVDRICREEGIPYWMDAGTLLGAVRHGGFIPWDDDLDICIMKDDYKRLRSAMLAKLPDNMAYQDWTSDPNHFEMSPRIRDLNSLFDLPLERYQKYRGLFLDVVLLERIPNMKVQHLVYLLYGRVTRTMHNYGKAFYKSGFRQLWTKTAAYCLWPLVWCITGFFRLYSRLTRSNVIGRYYVGFRNPRYLSQIFPLTEIEFEGHKFYAPGDFDGYLKAMFHDYMSLPPEQQRGGHHVNIELY